MLLACSFVLFVAASDAAAQTKKVYVSVDMEGISGVVGDDQTSAGQPEYNRSRKLMAEDANAAIRGAFEGGATEVVVNDSHGSQRNLLPEDLDPRARLISHSFKRHGMVEGLDETFDAVIFVGYHAKADSPRGLFAHTGSGVVKDVQVNGRSAGEGGLNTMMAQWFGVPVVMISGDDVAVEQQKEWTPNVRGVVVKRAINMRAVEARPIAEARRDIQAAAKEAVADRARLRVNDSPLTTCGCSSAISRSRKSPRRLLKSSWWPQTRWNSHARQCPKPTASSACSIASSTRTDRTRATCRPCSLRGR